MKQVKIYRRSVHYKKFHGLGTISEWQYAVAHAGFVYKQPSNQPEKEAYYKSGWIHIETMRSFAAMDKFVVELVDAKISFEGFKWIADLFDDIKTKEKQRNADKKPNSKE